MTAPPKLKILVAIASYGRTNDEYLDRLVKEYRSMSFDVDIVVLTNMMKEVDPGVELAVIQPMKNPWTLPFAHKRIFAERLNDYDLFIYSEDDVLMTEKNILAFLNVSKVLPDDKILGFLRFEIGENGKVSYPEVHGHFHWDSESVQAYGDDLFAAFTNEHSACYVMTRDQLRRAIDSGGFLLERWEGKYDLICTAATDPYLHCGFKKVICISRLDDFLVPHLSGKYTGTHFVVDGSEMRRQIAALMKIGQNGHRPSNLFQTESKLRGGLFSKGYYEPINPALMIAIPPGTRTVLSVGCGWGALEAKLAATGLKVVAVPLDAVIAGSAEVPGVEVVLGDFNTARQKLAGRQFDCLLVSNVLHLVDDPVKILTSFAELLSPGSAAIIAVPNLLRFKATYAVAKKIASYARVRLPIICMKMFGDRWFRTIGDFEQTGVQTVSISTLRGWAKAAGLRLEHTVTQLPPRANVTSRITLGLLDHVLADDILAVAKKP